MRPYWKGYLKLALVSCPIALHAACSTAERIALRQINKATGNRLRQQLIDEETRKEAGPAEHGDDAQAHQANMRLILLAMMKSFSCSPLIFFVLSETVA